MIVLGGSVRPVGQAPGGLSGEDEAPVVDDVWAYRLGGHHLTQLLAPSATAPRAQPTSRPGPGAPPVVRSTAGQAPDPGRGDVRG